MMTEPRWRKSTYSQPNGECVEMADLDDGVAVRDSKNPAGPILLLTRGELRAFLAAVKDGEFDDLT